MSQKGPAWERNFCVMLSNWWSGETADDWFWRTSGSGARATTRAKTKKRTVGHYGDIGPCCPEAEILTSTILFELKRGYSKHTIADILDKPEKGKVQVYEDWFERAEAKAREAHIPTWMVIAKRDRREAIVYMPSPTFNWLWINCGHNNGFDIDPFLSVSWGSAEIAALWLSKLLLTVDPNKVRKSIQGGYWGGKPKFACRTGVETQ